jgi:hypothetical protein
MMQDNPIVSIMFLTAGTSSTSAGKALSRFKPGPNPGLYQSVAFLGDNLLHYLEHTCINLRKSLRLRRCEDRVCLMLFCKK